MIVKVQISQFDSEGRTMMLVYDKKRKLMYEGQATEDVFNKMGGEPKKYFHAEVINTKIVIDKEAEWQNW